MEECVTPALINSGRRNMIKEVLTLNQKWDNMFMSNKHRHILRMCQHFHWSTYWKRGRKARKAIAKHMWQRLNKNKLLPSQKITLPDSPRHCRQSTRHTKAVSPHRAAECKRLIWLRTCRYHTVIHKPHGKNLAQHRWKQFSMWVKHTRGLKDKDKAGKGLALLENKNTKAQVLFPICQSKALENCLTSLGWSRDMSPGLHHSRLVLLFW